MRRNTEQTGNGKRREWSSDSGIPTVQVAGFSTLDARKGVGEMTSCQRAMEEVLITGIGIYFSDKRLAIVTTLKEQGYLKGVSAPTDWQIRAACAERLLLVEEQYLTARKDVLDVTLVQCAKAARDGAIAAAECRTAFDTSPPGGLAAITGPSPNATPQRHPTAARGL